MYSFSDLRIVSLILEYAKLHHFFNKSCLYQALLNMSKLQISRTLDVPPTVDVPRIAIKEE